MVIRIVFAGLRVVFGWWPRRSLTGRLIPALAVAAGMLFVAAGDVRSQGEVRESVRARCDQLIETGSLRVRGADIAAVIAIPLFYQANGYEAVWTDPADIRDIMTAAEEMYADGLHPEDYHRTALESIDNEVSGTSGPDADLVADRELLLMDSLMRMIYHAEFGKVDPEQLDPNWNIHKEFRTDELVAAIRDLPGTGRVLEYVNAAKPQHQLYTCLKNTLARYRDIEKSGGWESVPAGTVLKKGMSHDNVVALRMRLAVTGDLPEDASVTSAEFDEDLEAAVKYFQDRHGLADDGVVGKATFEALNVSVGERIDQLRVNLERGRWVLQDFTDTFLMVNIAGFRVYYVAENKITWSTRAQVGKTYRQTPIFRAETEYLVFNPTWTVPPTILAKDVLPAIQKDIGYLTRKNMVVIGRNGKQVDPATIEWSKYTGANFPYVIRQEPGPENALGRVKFIFPNKHFVFLHDTPSKSLFEQAERTFSSGCIRVENPFELAEILLADKGYGQTRIGETLKSGDLENVYLAKPLPTLLLYWTAFTTLAGKCNFRNDIYDRDRTIAKALDGPITARKGHQAERDRAIKELRNNR